VDAQDVFLVMAADIGQAAQKQAEVFHETCNVTGVIITKMDGTAKGGGALAACAVTGAPVHFIGVGEKTDAFEEFKPGNFVGRLLGMGDMEALLDKTREAFTEEDAMDLSKRLLKGEFTLIDLYEQMQALKKMGPISKVMELVPGFSQVKIPKEALQVQEEKSKVWRHVMDSCTKAKLAGVPLNVIKRAKEIQSRLESEDDVNQKITKKQQSRKAPKQKPQQTNIGDYNG